MQVHIFVGFVDILCLDFLRYVLPVNAVPVLAVVAVHDDQAWTYKETISELNCVFPPEKQYLIVSFELLFGGFGEPDRLEVHLEFADGFVIHVNFLSFLPIFHA